MTTDEWYAEQPALRVGPLAQAGGQAQVALTDTDEMRGRYGDRVQRGPNLSLIMAHDPGLPDLFVPLSIYLASSGTLSPRDREIAVLRVAWLDQLPFVWGEHVRLGKQVGITSDEIERITTGSAAEGWSRHDRAILRAVEELHHTADLSDAAWNDLAEDWSEGELVELPILIGSYKSLGYFQAAVRFPRWEGNPGMSAR